MTKAKVENSPEERYEKQLDRMPEKLILRRAASIRGSRGEKGGQREGAGRKPQYVPCPRCGQQVTKTQATRGHGCR